MSPSLPFLTLVRSRSEIADCYSFLNLADELAIIAFYLLNHQQEVEAYGWVAVSTSPGCWWTQPDKTRPALVTRSRSIARQSQLETRSLRLIPEVTRIILDAPIGEL